MNGVFHYIPTLFNNQGEESILTIVQQDDEYTCHVSNHPPSSSIKEETLQCLKDIIGENRLKRICQKPNIHIDISQINQKTLLLTKSVVRKIFIGFLDIQYEDLDDVNDIDDIDDKFNNMVNIDDFDDVQSFFNGTKSSHQRF